MRNHFPKIIISGLILTLAAATVLCCNFSWAQAASKAMPGCHMHKDKAQSQKGNGDCCIDKRLQAELPTKISFPIFQLIAGYVSLCFFFPKLFSIENQFNFAYLNGPPGPISPPPLYINLRNFRV